MPNSKPMGILDVGAAACQSSHPSLCLRARVFRSKTSTCVASPAFLCFSWPFPARRSRHGHAPIPSFLHGHKKAQRGTEIFRVFRSKTSTCAASPASLCFSWPFPARRSRHGHAPIPSFLHGHKKAQKFSVCFAVEKTARPAKFLFHFIFTRDTEARRRAGRGMAMKTRF
jgi:hypothetical protein